MARASCARSTSKGSPIGEARFTFTARRIARPKPRFDLPVEIRNDIARLEIAGERSAGAVQLLDRRWRRRAVGVSLGRDRRYRAAAAGLDLLSVARAVAVRRCAASPTRRARSRRSRNSLDQKLPMIVLADVGTLSPEIRDRLTAWIEQGGVLVRFAGPRLAAGR